MNDIVKYIRNITEHDQTLKIHRVKQAGFEKIHEKKQLTLQTKFFEVETYNNLLQNVKNYILTDTILFT